MKAGNPIEALAAAVHKAVLIDLSPVEYPEVIFDRKEGVLAITRKETGRTLTRRPDIRQCRVHMFNQTWGSTALGFGGLGGAAITDAYTVVVFGPNDDACVYFDGRFAYRIERPNVTFHEDLAAWLMVKVDGAAERYERTGGV